MSDAAPFSARTVAILVIDGALLMLAAILLSGFGNDIARVVGDAPAADRSDGAGYHALRRLIDAVQPPVRDLQRDTPDILILTPTEATRPEEVKAIIDHRIALANHANETTNGTPQRFPTLLILPKWRVERIPLQGGRVRRTGFADPVRVAALIPADADPHGEQVADTGVMRDTGYTGLLPFAMPDRPVNAVAGEAIAPLIGARDGAAVLGQIGSSDTFVLADPDTVNNRALADVRNAQAAIAMLRAIDPEHGGRAVFDRTLHYGAGDRNLVKLLFLPPFLGVTLALIAAAILAGIAAAQRFGPVARGKPALAAGKRALVDNIVALTRLAGRTAYAGPRHAEVMSETIGRVLGLAGADADRLERHHPGYRAIDHALRTARSEGEALAAARALHAWKKEAGA